MNIKTKELSYRFLRMFSQIIFLVTVLIIGVQFYHFSNPLETGNIPLVERPPGVDAFLPIGALVSLKYYSLTGVVNDIHPSGFYILVFILLISYLFKKAFCSWVCPIGFISEMLTKLYQVFFLRDLKIPHVLDVFFRSLKYFLLLFFLWSVLYQMNQFVLKNFIHSSFNIISEFKMLKFFTEMSLLTGLVLIGLIIVTFLFKHFWCRYLCPYGALLGTVSLFSPFKIRRNEKFCTSCGQCNRSCPSRIQVSIKQVVFSDECTGCGNCLDACPEKEALSFSLPNKRTQLKPIILIGIIILIFWGGSEYLDYRGKWQNSLKKQDYFYHLMNQGLLDIHQIEHTDEFIRKLDRKSKIEFMRQMMQQ